MPILNMAKKAEADVPDELPSLPEEEPKEEQKEAKEEPKEEPQEESSEELAPDELPSLPEKPEPKPEPRKMAPRMVMEEEPEPEPEPQPEPVPKILDQRLYFAKLLKKINEGAPIEQIAKEIHSREIIHALKENAGQNTKEDQKKTLEREIKALMLQLQMNEKEWASLKTDIDNKKARIDDIEKKIKEATQSIKKKLSDIEEIAKGF